MEKIQKSWGAKMFGLGDFWVSFAFVANIVVTLICVIYGIITWNSGGEADGVTHAVSRSQRGKN